MSGIHVHNYDDGSQPAEGAETWDTSALQRDFVVEGFMAPLIYVTRKSDGVKGTMHFLHGPPRVYFSFVPVPS